MKRQCEFLILLATFAVAFSAVTATKGIKRGKNKDMSRLTLGERQILSQLNMDLALTECLSEFWEGSFWSNESQLMFFVFYQIYSLLL